MSERAHQRADVFETPSRLPHHWSRLGLLMLSCSILSVTGCRDFSEFDCFNQPNGCAEEVVTAPMIEGSMDSMLQGASDMMITQRPDRDRDVTRPRDAAVDRDEVDRGQDVRDEGMETSRDIDVVLEPDRSAPDLEVTDLSLVDIALPDSAFPRDMEMMDMRVSADQCISLMRRMPRDLDVRSSYGSQWESGYCCNLQITNRGMSEIYGWQITFSVRGTISHTWDANASQVMNVVTLRPLGNWFTRIPANETRRVGFCANL